MALQDSLYGQITAFYSPKPFDGFEPVMGACRIKTAGRGFQRRQEFLIKPDQCDKQLFHFNHLSVCLKYTASGKKLKLETLIQTKVMNFIGINCMIKRDVIKEWYYAIS